MIHNNFAVVWDTRRTQNMTGCEHRRHGEHSTGVIRGEREHWIVISQFENIVANDVPNAFVFTQLNDVQVLVCDYALVVRLGDLCKMEQMLDVIFSEENCPR